MTDCLFCKIATGEIPSYKIYEDNLVMAFLDIHPRAPGHTVVIPKGHYPTLFELPARAPGHAVIIPRAHYETLLGVPDGEIGPLWIVVKKVAAHIKEALKTDGFTIGMNHGAVSGQTVPHLHVHIMPRFEGDGGKSIHSVVHNPGEIPLEEMVEKLKM